jgi:hypothetical protein
MGRLSRSQLLAASAAFAACALDESAPEPGPEKLESFCTLAGCGPAFELRTLIDASFESVQSADVRVCRNDECRRGTFRADTESRQASTDLAPSSESGPGAAVIWVYVSATDSEQLDLQLYWFNWDWSQPLEAGPDEYDVTIEANGKTLFTTHKTVSEYEVGYPNGKKCGPTCSKASFVDE